MTDGQYRTVDFRNTALVMTRNLGSHDIQRIGQGYRLAKEAEKGEVRRSFRSEFVNRIDEIVVFHALDARHIASIVKIQLKRLEQQPASQDMKLEVSDAALREIAKAGFDPVYGARRLKRAIQQQIEHPLARRVREGKLGPNDVVPVNSREGKFTFEGRCADVWTFRNLAKGTAVLPFVKSSEPRANET